MPGLTAAVFTILLSGCAAGPDYTPPATPKVSSYTDDTMPAKTVAADVPGGEAQVFMPDSDLQANWWTLFSSDDLNSLVEEAVRNSPDLEAAQASLREAQEIAYASEGGLFPFLDLSLSPTRQKTSGASFGQPNAQSSLFTLYNASVNVSYALDVFGGVRREIESQQALADLERFRLEGTYLSLTANVITAAVQEASLREQIKETQRIIDIEKNQLGVLNEQLKMGTLTQASVLAQETTLVQTQANLPSLYKQLAQLRHRLSVLTGHYPSEPLANITSLASLKLPRDIPVSLPSRLVEQRPDIKAAEAQLRAASADVGIATANMLPQINLTGRYGTQATHFGDLFGSGAEIWSLGAGLLQPIFHGGQLLHQRRAAVAAYERAAAQYRSTVLLAFQNVADALRALQFDAETLRAQIKAANVAAKSMEMSQTQFKAGTIDYLTVLDAQRTYLQARLTLIQARANRFADTAALFQALGGGWWNRDKPAKTELVAENTN